MWTCSQTAASPSSSTRVQRTVSLYGLCKQLVGGMWVSCFASSAAFLVAPANEKEKYCRIKFSRKNNSLQQPLIGNKKRPTTKGKGLRSDLVGVLGFRCINHTNPQIKNQQRGETLKQWRGEVLRTTVRCWNLQPLRHLRCSDFFFAEQKWRTHLLQHAIFNG